MKIKLFEKEKYKELEPIVKKHYNKKLLMLLLSYSISLYFIFALHSFKTAVIVFIGITAGILYKLYEIQLFCNGKVKKITGTCIKILQDNKLENLEKRALKSNVFFGKCILYVQVDDKIYEILSPQNKINEKGAEVTIWYNGNSFSRKEGIEVIHEPYLVNSVMKVQEEIG